MIGFSFQSFKDKLDPVIFSGCIDAQASSALNKQINKLHLFRNRFWFIVLDSGWPGENRPLIHASILKN